MIDFYKKRQHLPLFQKLNYKVDIEKLKKEFFENNLDDYSKYDGLKMGTASENGALVRRILLGHFLNEEETKERENDLICEGGEAYKMLCLTDYDEEKAGHPFDVDKIKDLNPELVSKARMLERIHDTTHPLYVPEADERNYTKPNQYLKGYVKEIRDSFKCEMTRSRYAVLKAHEQIKPHIDLNTNHAIRFHIPLITNEKVIFGVKGKNRTVELNMPADGSVWFINVAYTHWVKNDGDEDRIHLIFSAVGQQDLNESLEIYPDIKNQAAA